VRGNAEYGYEAELPGNSCHYQDKRACESLVRLSTEGPAYPWRSLVTPYRSGARVLVAVVSCLVFLGHLHRATGQEPPPGLEAVVDRVVQRFLGDNDIPGAAVGIVRDGKLLYAKGHGVRSVERQEPVAVNTLFQIGSVTKVFTTTLLLQLRDEGRLALDDPVGTYLPAQAETPSWRQGEERVMPTLRHLATHRAGLPRNPPNRRDRPHSPSVMEPYSIAELYQGLAKTTLTSRPGTAVQYSNYGFGVLSHVLERATGQPYEALLHEKLLAPLAMMETARLTARDRSGSPHHWPKGKGERALRLARCAPLRILDRPHSRSVAMHLGHRLARRRPLRAPRCSRCAMVATFGTDEQRGITTAGSSQTIQNWDGS
jgi:CubicO group peptidase (beta-lactamase class C family)